MKKVLYLVYQKQTDMLPTTSTINGIEIKAIYLAVQSFDALDICKGNKFRAINNTLYFLTGEKDYSKHIELKVSASVYLDEIIKEKA
jgi:hypothetical protein